MMKRRLLFISLLITAIVGTSIFTAFEANAKKKKRTPITLGPNPFITHMFTADPSAHVWKDGRLYVYPSQDLNLPRGWDMDNYHVFSTDDMVNWKDHGEILNSSQVPWGRPEGGCMWAPDCAYKDGIRVKRIFIVHGKSGLQQASIRQKILRYKGISKVSTIHAE